MRLLPPAAQLLATAALSLVLVACSFDSYPGSGASAASTTPAPAGTASGTPTTTADADPDAGLLTGRQLKAALAPASFFPSGFVLDAGGSRDTGDTYAFQTRTKVPRPDCTRLDGTSWIGITGIGGVSFAQNDRISKNPVAEVAQEVDVFRGTTARTAIGALARIAAVCPSFKDPQTGGKVRVSEHTAAGIGDTAYTITLSNPAWENGTTLVAARVGTAVVTVLSSNTTDDGAATAKKVARLIAANLRSKA